jgi:hypothetical protein
MFRPPNDPAQKWIIIAFFTLLAFGAWLGTRPLYEVFW